MFDAAVKQMSLEIYLDGCKIDLALKLIRSEVLFVTIPGCANKHHPVAHTLISALEVHEASVRLEQLQKNKQTKLPDKTQPPNWQRWVVCLQ